MNRKAELIALMASALMFYASLSQVLADAPSRRDEATVNADLLLNYPTTWDPYVWHWNNLGLGERVGNDQYSWIYWHDGHVNMRCEDHGAFDLIWLATNFDQAEAQGLETIHLNRLNLWFEATISDIGGSSVLEVYPWDWTGAKFDIVVVEDGTNRKIMMEMYIWRTGANCIWGAESVRETTPGSGVYNYLVALDHLADYLIQTDEGGLIHYTINVLGLLKRGIGKFNNEYGVNPPFDVADFKVERVDFCLEAATTVAPLIFCPYVYATLDYLRARYDVVDLNGDGRVDIYDVVLVTGLYGSQMGDENWDFRGDINTDGVIDIYDVVIIAGSYGQTF